MASLSSVGRISCVAWMVIVVLASVSGLLLPSTATAAPQESVRTLTAADAQSWLDATVPQLRTTNRVPSVVISIVSGDTVVAQRGYGSATHPSPQPDDPGVDPATTLYRPGSVTKLVTAIAVMQLVEQGRLDLDTNIETYLDFTLGTPQGVVTLRHLLSHTAGFEAREEGLFRSVDQARSLEATVKTDSPEQIFVPGTTPAYSNYGYALLGYIVQRVSGQRYEDYAQAHIFQSLGMTSSTVEQPLPVGWSSRMAAAFDSSSEGSSDATPLPFEVIDGAPAGGLTTTASDMARLVGSMLADEKLLKRATWERMGQPAWGPGAKLGNRADQTGLGFARFEYAGHAGLDHLGSTGAYMSDLRLFPGSSLGYFISTTTSSGAANPANQRLMDAVLTGFADRYVGQAESPRATPTAVEHAQAVAGWNLSTQRGESTYFSIMNRFTTIHLAAAADGTLSLGTMRLVETSPWVFHQVGGPNVVSAVEEDGQVQRILMYGAIAWDRTTVWTGPLVWVPIMGGGGLLLVLAVVAWPLAAGVRRIRHRPFDRPRLDALLRVGMLAGAGAFVLALGALMLGLPRGVSLVVPASAVWSMMFFLSLTVAAVVPGLVLVVRSVRAHRGWVSIGSASAVTLGLVLVAIPVLSQHMLKFWDITF